MRPTAWLSALAMVSLTSCAGSGPATTSAACDIFKPIYFQDADQMTRATEKAIIAHNERGARICGWR